MNKVVRGRDGRDGRDGEVGSPGRNAYEMACEAGYGGSLQLFLEQIIGRAALCDGEGIYQSAVANGYRGDFEDLIKLLQGPIGPQGPKGEPGKSAFEIAVEQGFRGNVHEWLKSLRGKDGKDGRDGDRGPRGEKGEKGDKGEPGKTIYLGGGGGGGGTPTPGGGAVDSVNGQTGVVVLDAGDVGADSAGAAAAAQAAAEAYADALTASDVGADPAGSAAAAQAAAVQRANHTGTQAISTVTSLQATLDAKADLVGGLVPSAQIPAIAITEYLGSVANQAAMLALVGQKGDWAIRSDSGLTYVITGNDPTQLADWTALSYPGAPVTSVNGQTGVVSLSAANVGAPSGSGNSTGTNTGDQTSIVGITGTLAQFNTAITDANIGTAGLKDTGTSGNTVPLLDGANTWSAAQTYALGTITTSQPLTISQTLNAAGVAFEGLLIDWTSTASAAASLPINVKVGGTSILSVTKGGVLQLPDGSAGTPSLKLSTGPTNSGFYSGGANDIGISLAAVRKFAFNDQHFYVYSGQIYFGASGDAGFGRAAANSFVFGPATTSAGAATTRTELNKAVTGIADATATDVFTVTIPNASHSAMVRVTLCGKIGAGGAIGAGEATGTITYDIAIARTAGVNAVATISAAYGSAVCAVAGATTITVAGTLGAITGAVGASNTFTIKVTITKGGGASANHTCVAYAKLLNANATGVTIA